SNSPAKAIRSWKWTAASKPGRKRTSKSKPGRASRPASANPLSAANSRVSLCRTLCLPLGRFSTRGWQRFGNQRRKIMKVTSNAFTEGGKIPDKYSKYGENRIPPLHFEAVPERAHSLALIVDDPDAPSGTFNHWLLFNLDPKTKDIKEDCVPVMATQGRNDYGEVGY